MLSGVSVEVCDAAVRINISIKSHHNSGPKMLPFHIRTVLWCARGFCPLSACRAGRVRDGGAGAGGDTAGPEAARAAGAIVAAPRLEREAERRLPGPSVRRRHRFSPEIRGEGLRVLRRG